MDAPVSDRIGDRAAGADIRWRLLTILTTSYGAGAFGMLGISPLSPSLVEGLGLTRFQVAFIVPSIYLAGLLFSLPRGRLPRLPLLPLRGRRGLERGEPHARQGNHGRLPGARARHRDGREADGSH